MTPAVPPAPAEIARLRRPPETVMRLARMGSAHPTRLSFLRQLLRRMRTEGWRAERLLWQVDARGEGRAVYRVTGPVRSYSLVAFAHDLPDHMRSDRVIATAWDATFALVDGTPTPTDLDRLAAHVPLQEAGRIGPGELSLSRANRSVRLFDHVVGRLAEGRQPDAALLAETGYLMRTTAVYGSGKFGAAAHADLQDRPEMAAPFQAEMLSVWLTRAFTFDLVEHLARVRGGTRAVPLDPALKRGLGVGNSTGLGMAPFLVNHPALISNWVMARETALARVRAQPDASPEAVAGFARALAAAQANAADWRSDHPLQQARLADLRRDLDRLEALSANGPWSRPQPWEALWQAAAGLSAEGQEALLALMLEPHGALVDDLGPTMAADEAAEFGIDGAMPVGRLRAHLETACAWALAPDYAGAEAARFWYVSEEKLEPRLGERAEEDGAERELPLATGRMLKELHAALGDWPDTTPVARLLLACPRHRHSLRRAQVAMRHPYAEIRDNLIGAGMLPIDMLRFKLAFFGATRFDPRSDRWVRVSLMQDAALLEDFADGPP